MSHKAISLSTAAAILAAYLWSQLQPSAALFLLMSPSLAVNLCLLALSIFLVYLSFLKKFKSVRTYALTLGCSIVCIVFGGIGLISSGYNYNFFNALGPLDFLLITQIGVILALCALSAQHQPLKLKALQSAGLPHPRVRFGLPRLALHQRRNVRFG